MRSAPYAQVRVREPLGERILGETISVGGSRASGAVVDRAVSDGVVADGAGAEADPDILVPGTDPGVSVRIERDRGVWFAQPVGKSVRLNGRLLTALCDLRKHDTLNVGAAQIVVRDVSRTLLRLDVHHLVGNATIAPTATLATLLVGDGGDDDVEIHPLDSLRIPSLPKPNARPSASARPPSPYRWWITGLAVALLATVAMISSTLEPVTVEVHPVDARVLTPGTVFVIHNPNHLLLLPGKHVVKAERDGYVTAQADIEVRKDEINGVRLWLEKLPGKLNIDTGGVTATVSVDGVEVGHAPGVLSVPAGQRTVMISAPRYVDFIANVAIEGAGQRQDLRASLQTSWGSLKVLSVPEGAHVSIDGVNDGVTPLVIAAPSGVRRVQIAADGKKTWESSVVLKAGETLSVGPVTLGQPDAHLTVRSDPVGADATVAGTHLGRTPAEIDLPSGIAHQVVLSAPGYKNWIRAVFADPGRKLSVLARLEPILAQVRVQGEPADADLVVDGVVRGKAPQSFELTATEHHIEVRKQGFQPFKDVVTPEAGLDRTVQYHLVPIGQTNTPR